jgi:hypothetical protein
MSKNVAILNENTVINIIIVNDDYKLNADEVFYTNENPAFMQGTYVDGYFYSPQPFLSWTRNQGNWNPPTPRPTTEGKFYYWSEDDLSWKEITND